MCQMMGGSLAELGSDLDIDQFSMWIRTELAELRSNRFSVGGFLTIILELVTESCYVRSRQERGGGLGGIREEGSFLSW